MMWVADIKCYWQQRRFLPVVQVQCIHCSDTGDFPWLPKSLLLRNRDDKNVLCAPAPCKQQEKRRPRSWVWDLLYVSSGLVIAQPVLLGTELSRSLVTLKWHWSDTGCHWHQALEGWAAWEQRFPSAASLCSLHCLAALMGSPVGASSCSEERGEIRGNPKGTEDQEQNLLPRNASVVAMPVALHTGRSWRQGKHSFPASREWLHFPSLEEISPWDSVFSLLKLHLPFASTEVHLTLMENVQWLNFLALPDA